MLWHNEEENSEFRWLVQGYEKFEKFATQKINNDKTMV
jgi:hypothetical protein